MLTVYSAKYYCIVGSCAIRRRIQAPSKHLKWSFFANITAFNCWFPPTFFIRGIWQGPKYVSNTVSTKIRWNLSLLLMLYTLFFILILYTILYTHGLYYLFYSKRDFSTDGFLWILQNFSEHLFYRKPPAEFFLTLLRT